MRQSLLLEAGVHIDRFVLEQRLGAGGQGAVWKAVDTHTGAIVALKIASRPESDPLGGTTFIERARREASVLGALSHPSIVRCRTLIEDFEHNFLVLVLDWVEGTSAATAQGDPRFSLTLRETLLHHVAHALAYLHQHGVVHRDIKLDNIVVSQRFWSSPADPSTVKIVDLGIAVESLNPRALTEPGTVIGTPAYMSPERLDPRFWGVPPSSPAVDVFAFGVLGWFLMAGEHPTGLQRGAALLAYAAEYRRVNASGQAWPARAIGGLWGEVLSRCLSIDLSRRPPNGMAIVELLGGPTEMYPTSSARAPSMPSSTSTLSPASGPTQFTPQPPVTVAGPYSTQPASRAVYPPPSSRQPSSPTPAPWASNVSVAYPARPPMTTGIGERSKRGLFAIAISLAALFAVGVTVLVVVAVSMSTGGRAPSAPPPAPTATTTNTEGRRSPDRIPTAIVITPDRTPGVVRDGPGFSYQKRYEVPMGGRVTITGTGSNDGWIPVQTAAGQSGWMHRDILRPE